MTARFTYAHLVELVDDDHELIARLLEEGVIEEKEGEEVMVNVDGVMVARTLRELEVDWSGIAIILRLVDELASARKRIAELESDEPPTDAPK